MKKEKCGVCNGTGEVEVLESEEDKFYRETASPILKKAFNLPTWCWNKYNAQRRYGLQE